MKDLINFHMAMALSFMNELETQNKEWKKRILDEWEKSKNYPRKKKKRVRKELQLDWSIANWNPFEV
jgi:hypothetical protein